MSFVVFDIGGPGHLPLVITLVIHGVRRGTFGIIGVTIIVHYVSLHGCLAATVAVSEPIWSGLFRERLKTGWIRALVNVLLHLAAVGTLQRERKIIKMNTTIRPYSLFIYIFYHT